MIFQISRSYMENDNETITEIVTTNAVYAWATLKRIFNEHIFDSAYVNFTAWGINGKIVCRYEVDCRNTVAVFREGKRIPTYEKGLMYELSISEVK